MTLKKLILAGDGQFYWAEPAQVSCVAVVWSAARGGAITDYIYLGDFEARGQAVAACQARGLTPISSKGPPRVGPAVEIDGVAYDRPLHIPVIRED